MSITPFRILCLLLAIIALLGVDLAFEIGGLKFTDPTIPKNANNFYTYTLSHFEPLSLYATVAFFIALGYFSNKRAFEFKWGQRLLASPKLPLYVALAVVLFAGFGRFLVYQDFDLCVDEYLSQFEANILQQHHLMAPIPENWVKEEHAMNVPFQIFKQIEDKTYWASGFLPGYAFLNFLFNSLYLGWALGPLMAGASILLLASLGRRAFPKEAIFAANCAVLLLVCSPQFIAMALTKFAWPGHLCGTLLWVWLITHSKRSLFLLTPILGVFLIGLHQPQVHFLVAAPFLLRLLYRFQWRDMIWFGAWYLWGIWVWFHVYTMLRPSMTGVGGDLNNLGFPYALSIFITSCHFITFYAWMTPILLPLMLIAIANLRMQPALVWDSILAAALTFFFYLSFPHFQGHGWGYRFMHPAYGLLALVGAGGLVAWGRIYKTSIGVNALMCSAIFSLTLQLPYRIYELRTMVCPLAWTWDYVASRPSDFVLIKTSEFWYACDLIRNDPWLKKKPLVFDANGLSEEQVAKLHRLGTVSVVGANEARPFGVIISDPSKAAVK